MWLFFTLLSAGFWATENVIDSVIVHKYQKDPFALTLLSGIVHLPFILLFPLFVDVRTPWAPLLIFGGFMLCLAILIYYYVMDRIDASVTQSAWAIESIIVTAMGFLWLHETWSTTQTIGSALILLGVFLLCYWHKHISLFRTVALLSLLAVVASPSEIFIKLALEDATSIIACVFWYLVGRSVSCAFMPLWKKGTFLHAIRFAKTAPQTFHIWFIGGTFLSVMAYFSITTAYAFGTLSLVYIAGNVQPFLVILFAWLLSKISKTHVPKELLTKQSLQVKITSFAFVFVGLALLT